MPCSRLVLCLWGPFSAGGRIQTRLDSDQKGSPEPAFNVCVSFGLPSPLGPMNHIAFAGKRYLFLLIGMESTQVT